MMFQTGQSSGSGGKFTSPQLAAHFAEEEADGEQTERGGGAQNTGPVVMQVLPKPSCKSLGITYRTLIWANLSILRSAQFLRHVILKDDVNNKNNVAFNYPKYVIKEREAQRSTPPSPEWEIVERLSLIRLCQLHQVSSYCLNRKLKKRRSLWGGIAFPHDKNAFLNRLRFPDFHPWRVSAIK